MTSPKPLPYAFDKHGFLYDGEEAREPPTGHLYTITGDPVRYYMWLLSCGVSEVEAGRRTKQNYGKMGKD